MIYAAYELYAGFLWVVVAVSTLFLIMSGLKFVLWHNDPNEEQ